MKVWLNSALVDQGRARIDPADRGFLLGDGLFETLLAVNGRIVHGAAHLRRLRQGAEHLEIPLDDDDAALLDACVAVLVANGIMGRAVLRLTLTRGAGPRGLVPPEAPRPTVLITAAPAPSPPDSFSLVTAEARCTKVPPLSRFKTLNYLDNVLARRAAQRKGADEAVMLNSAGRAVCASAANLWVIEGGALITPPLSDGALPGITRARVFEAARALGVAAIEESLSPERLAAAEEIFLTSSLIGACPVHALDSRVLRPRLGVRIQEALAAREA